MTCHIEAVAQSFSGSDAQPRGMPDYSHSITEQQTERAQNTAMTKEGVERVIVRCNLRQWQESKPQALTRRSSRMNASTPTGPMVTREGNREIAGEMTRHDDHVILDERSRSPGKSMSRRPGHLSTGTNPDGGHGRGNGSLLEALVLGPVAHETKAVRPPALLCCRHPVSFRAEVDREDLKPQDLLGSRGLEAG